MIDGRAFVGARLIKYGDGASVYHTCILFSEPSAFASLPNGLECSDPRSDRHPCSARFADPFDQTFT